MGLGDIQLTGSFAKEDALLSDAHLQVLKFKMQGSNLGQGAGPDRAKIRENAGVIFRVSAHRDQ
eukprot:6202047-Pleurochrysis_carterae.AAC.1